MTEPSRIDAATGNEEALRERERYLHTILQTTADGFWVIDRQGLVADVNEAYCALSGYRRDELIGMSLGDIDADEQPSGTAERIERIIANGSEVFEARHRRKDGSLFPVEISATFVPQQGGRFVCFCRDLTRRKHDEERLTLMARMLDEAPASIVVHDDDGRFLFANRATFAMHGFSEEEFMALNLRTLDVPESESLLAERFRLVAEEGEARFEVRHHRKDGSIIPLEVSAKRITWGGRPAVLSIAVDITARKRAEEAFHLKSEEVERYFRSSLDLLCIANTDGQFVRLNPEWEKVLGYSIEELEHHRFLDFVHPDDLDSTLAAVASLSSQERVLNFENRYRCKDGSYRWIEWRSYPQGTLIYAAARDVTDRKRVEAALLESEALFRGMAEQMVDVLFRTDTAGGLTYLSPSCRAVLGWEPDEMVGRRFLDFVADRDVPKARKAYDASLEGKPASGSLSLVMKRKDGSEFTGELNGGPIVRDGAVAGALGLIRDITYRKEAERERERLRERLAQAEKMESVGRLAGGVAHDFNNMLGVILGHTELALGGLDPADPLHAELVEVRKAAERSADLTRQLLAFARKQTVAPRVLDLNDTVSGMLKMVRRLIGEDIDLAWRPGETLGPIRVDPSQIDQILVNLCVNARDAISDTGTVSLETGAATFDDAASAAYPGCVPGDYVRLSVGDTGCGMDADTLSRLFEPFFTTKATGKGTGLGLATVYGIVQQNGGFIHVESVPGRGTTFSVFLPRHAARASAVAGGDAAVTFGRGHETILLVEDEPGILDMTTRMLTRLGYTVLNAATPGAAIHLAREHAGDIHLLMTDVVMPEMNGRDLAANILTLYPDIKRLFMSGYTADVIAHHGVLDPGINFIQKPFSMAALTSAVREALGPA